MKVAIIEATLCDHPEFETFMDVYDSMKNAVQAAVDHLNEVNDEVLGNEGSVIIQQVCADQFSIRLKDESGEVWEKLYVTEKTVLTK